jgi:hypothetical protein
MRLSVGGHWTDIVEAFEGTVGGWHWRWAGRKEVRWKGKETLWSVRICSREDDGMPLHSFVDLSLNYDRSRAPF